MREPPLAYLISFRCYGTWLHGDERGSIDRVHNMYGSPYLPRNPDWRRYNALRLKHRPVVLSPAQRTCVEKSITETCDVRGWVPKAINVRTNHVHALVSTGERWPERVLNALKANATRQLRKSGYWPHEHSPWSDRGSKRYIWTEVGVQRAIEYVLNGQTGVIPEFD